MKSGIFTLWLAHGICGALAVFVIWPFGILKVRCDAIPQWLSHRTTQSFGALLLLLTGGIGLFQSNEIHSTHQIAGIILELLLLVQIFVGHCFRDLTVREWLYPLTRLLHLALGLTLLFLGWWTVVSGLVHAAFGAQTIAIVGLTTLTEITALMLYPTLCAWRTNSRRIPDIVIHGTGSAAGEQVQTRPMSESFDYDEA